jgi:hypothetical protein
MANKRFIGSSVVPPRPHFQFPLADNLPFYILMLYIVRCTMYSVKVTNLQMKNVHTLHVCMFELQNI